MVLQLRSRAQSVSQEASKIPIAPFASSFNDVGWNRHRGSVHLDAQRLMVGTTDLRDDPIRVQREGVRFPPNAQLLEISHSVRWPRRVHRQHHSPARENLSLRV